DAQCSGNASDDQPICHCSTRCSQDRNEVLQCFLCIPIISDDNGGRHTSLRGRVSRFLMRGRNAGQHYVEEPARVCILRRRQTLSAAKYPQALWEKWRI